MGKRWRSYRVGKYELGQLKGQAVAVWRDETGRHRRRLGIATTEGEARSRLDAFAREAASVRIADHYTIGNLWSDYEADRLKDGKLARNFTDSWKALRPRFETLPVDALTADVCRDYTKQRLKNGVSQGTIWTELTKLRSCINWAQKRGLITVAPYVWLPSKPKPRQRVLSPEEAIRLLDACVMPHLKLFVILALTTGARSGALMELTWDRVNMRDLTIDLREPEVIDPLTKAVRKGRGIVPVTTVAFAALKDAKKAALSDHVIEWNGAQVKKVRKAFMEAVVRAGLGYAEVMMTTTGKTAGTKWNKISSDVGPHTLRHTAASWAVNGGASMEFTAKLLGHSNPETTRRIYAKPDVDSLRPAARVIDMNLKRRMRR